MKKKVHFQGVNWRTAQKASNARVFAKSELVAVIQIEKPRPDYFNAATISPWSYSRICESRFRKTPYCRVTGRPVI